MKHTRAELADNVVPSNRFTDGRIIRGRSIFESHCVWRRENSGFNYSNRTKVIADDPNTQRRSVDDRSSDG